jgi:hypothetical protein
MSNAANPFTLSESHTRVMQLARREPLDENSQKVLRQLFGEGIVTLSADDLTRTRTYVRVVRVLD